MSAVADLAAGHTKAIELADNAYGPGHWAACDRPGNAPDDMTVFFLDCPACTTAVHTAISTPPDGHVYPGWWQDRAAFARMLSRPTVRVIGRKPDVRWRAR